ncbi:MAG: ATP-dependent protease ATPase subunit HslU [Deltaproteobacteria bacterium]|nr:ATP-dependent protease ATPase subunit HslU [Deltaproteobacteria bacterium]
MTEHETREGLEELRPSELVAYLDRFIVGQAKAKRAVAIALRNRWRRKRVPEDLRDEIAPKNIIMMGPTGVGKTEIARRLARRLRAPFVKVEASKYTEVGYVGRDVESILRDLMEVAVSMVRDEAQERVRTEARRRAEDRILEILLPAASAPAFEEVDRGAADASRSRTREKLRTLLRDGALDTREVEVSVQEKGRMPMLEVFSGQGLEEMGINMRDMFGNLFPKKTREKRMPIPQALEVLTQEEAARLVDNDTVVEEARRRVEEGGIVFLDELDKIAGREAGRGPDVSREGVQRDLLPLVEGTSVTTKYGVVRTDHVLFIAAGAFHVTKPSDLIPELQGRFPIRVELESLGRDEFLRILTEPENSLIRQYTEMMATEGIRLSFTPDAVAAVAEVAEAANRQLENIGARRLYTVLEALLEGLSFDAPERRGETVEIRGEDVRARIGEILRDQDLSRYIL